MKKKMQRANNKQILIRYFKLYKCIYKKSCKMRKLKKENNNL